jgi:hypothetical protein
MTAEEFRNIYRELIDENPLAIRAVLKVLAIEFTEEVSTLAVTLDSQPRLLVNLAFVGKHCRTDAEVKGVICHEFLHVLLRHTERFTRLTPPEHLALDAVINAIIHRRLGPDYSGMMSRYYENARGMHRLLRPPRDNEHYDRSTVQAAWQSLYAGRLVADDIRDLARDQLRSLKRHPTGLLGNHDDPLENSSTSASAEASAEAPKDERGLENPSSVLAQAIESSLKGLNSSEVFRSPRPGVGGEAYGCRVAAVDPGLTRWRREAYAVLRRHLEPDPKSAARVSTARSYMLPVLSARDRRAALRALWSPFLPDARWDTTVLTRTGSAQVYLDVSGSMNAEMPLIVALLGRLSSHIRRPFWAFSNVVAPARIEQGRLVSSTTGGTSMSCVLEHVARTRPSAAVVVTDGYIEALSPNVVAAAVAGTRLHVIITRDGNPYLLQRVGLPYTQLSKVPS